MTHAELDQIAARAIFTTDLLGKGTTLQNYVALTASERDAILTLAREGLAAREAMKVDATVTSTAPLDEETKRRMLAEQELINRARASVRLREHCACGAWPPDHTHVCATPPTSGPDGMR